MRAMAAASAAGFAGAAASLSCLGAASSASSASSGGSGWLALGVAVGSAHAIEQMLLTILQWAWGRSIVYRLIVSDNQ